MKEQFLGDITTGIFRTGLVTSADKSKVAYGFYERDLQWHIVVTDGNSTKSYDIGCKEISDIKLSHDGAHVAYAADFGTDMLVAVDGEEGQRYDEVSDITFSPNGKHIAYVARSGIDHYVVVDHKTVFHHGRDIPAYLKFSPDNQHILYVLCGSWGGTRFWVAMDGDKVGGDYDNVEISPSQEALFFDTVKNYHFIAYRDNHFFRADGLIGQ